MTSRLTPSSGRRQKRQTSLCAKITFCCCYKNKLYIKIQTSLLCSQRLLFFKLQLKKTISDCRKYRFCLGIFFSLHFQICTVVEEQDMYIELKSSGECSHYRRPQTPPPKKQSVWQNQTNKNNLFLYTTALCSVWHQSLVHSYTSVHFTPLLRNLRNKRLHENRKKQYFTTIHKQASEPLRHR